MRVFARNSPTHTVLTRPRQNAGMPDQPSSPEIVDTAEWLAHRSERARELGDPAHADALLLDAWAAYDAGLQEIKLISEGEQDAGTARGASSLEGTPTPNPLAHAHK